jgi:hypothetical protein
VSRPGLLYWFEKELACLLAVIDYSIEKVLTISKDSVVYTEGLREINSLINNIKGLRLLSNLILTGSSSWVFLVTDSVNRKILGYSGDSEALIVIEYIAVGCSN